MANIKSQIKRNRQNERRRMHNKVARSELKTRVKRAAEGLEAGADDAGDRVRAAQKRLGSPGNGVGPVACEGADSLAVGFPSWWYLSRPPRRWRRSRR